MKTKIEEYRNITDLEFGLLLELPKLRVFKSLNEGKEDNVFSNLSFNLENVIAINGVFEVIQKVDEGFICSNEESDMFYIIKDCPEMEVGDIYCRYFGNICKINKELADDEKFKGLFVEIDKWVEEGANDDWGRTSRNYSREKLISVEKVENGEITSEMISKLLETHKKVVEKREKEMEEEKEKEKKIKKVKECDEEKEYNTKGEGTFNYYSVLKNVIKGDGMREFVLEKDVNKIFSYDQIKSIKDRDTILTKIENFLTDNKVSYKKIKGGDEQYEVEYNNEKCKIGGVNIPKSKQAFILNRLNCGSHIKDIRILLKLNGMKADFISLENLRWSDGNLDIPIKNKAIDDNTFIVEFVDKAKTFNWEEIRDCFFYGNSRSVRSNFRNGSLLETCNGIGVSKKDLFEKLRRLKMLKGLEDENES